MIVVSMTTPSCWIRKTRSRSRACGLRQTSRNAANGLSAPRPRNSARSRTRATIQSELAVAIVPPAAATTRAVPRGSEVAPNAAIAATARSEPSPNTMRRTPKTRVRSWYASVSSAPSAAWAVSSIATEV